MRPDYDPESLNPIDYFYDSDSVIAQIEPIAGPLCTRCSAINLFKILQEDPIDDYSCKQDYCLGTVGEVLDKESTCGLCYLVLAALRASFPNVLRDDRQSRSLSLDTQLLQLFFTSALAGSYRLEDGERKLVTCLAVYTNAASSPADCETGENRAYVRLLGNDAHRIGQYPLYHGRGIGNGVSPALLCRWINQCGTGFNVPTYGGSVHSVCDEAEIAYRLTQNSPRSRIYIDTINLRLIEHHWARNPQYIALSYVWGGAQGLQLTKATRQELLKKEALRRGWGEIPAAIQDTIRLIRALNQESRYRKKKNLLLWVDQLCIVQDDPKSKAIQIETMAQIYSNAVATICIAQSKSARCPLSRFHAADELGLVESCLSQTHSVNVSTRSVQAIRNIQGLRLISGLPSLLRTLDECTWNTRAWTLQESELAHRAIIFTEHQVYFRCHEEIFQEDKISEVPATMLDILEERRLVNEKQRSKERKAREKTVKRRNKNTRSQRGSNIAESSTGGTRRLLTKRPDSQEEIPGEMSEFHNAFIHPETRNCATIAPSTWPKNFAFYAKTVEDYTSRSLSYPTDIINAFTGIATTINGISQWHAQCGLIQDTIDFSLLWRPKRKGLRRRGEITERSSGPETSDALDSSFPSWSWSGWEGAVTYQPFSHELKSLVDRFDVCNGDTKTRLFRCVDMKLLSKKGRQSLEKRKLQEDVGHPPPMDQGTISVDIEWKPLIYYLAYQLSLVKGPARDDSSRNFPSCLEFEARCMRVTVTKCSNGGGVRNDEEPNMSDLAGGSRHQDHRSSDCERVWLVEVAPPHRRIGTAWLVPRLTDSHPEVEIILLSKSRGVSEARDGWQYHHSVGAWHEWCMIDVMIIQRCDPESNSGDYCGKIKAERVTIGRIHEGCTMGAKNEVFSLA